MLKRKLISVPLLVFFLTSVGSPVFAAAPLNGEPNPFALPEFATPLHLAQAPSESSDEKAPMSPECEAFALDPNADVGDIMRAGCEPTLAQMSALMDNPLSNVAMWRCG